MYTLIIANKNYSSWSLRPWVLLKARGIPFEEKLVPFPGGDSFDYYRKHSPNGRVPCLIDGEVAVWDSLAIVEYVAERHPGVWPADPAFRAFSRSAAAEMHSSFSALRNMCGMSCGQRVTLKELPAGLKRDIARIAELWGEGLRRSGGPFLGGREFGGLDAFFAPVAFRAQSYGLDFGADGNAYVARILAVPAMREWYEAALVEPWRDEEHEAEVRQYGTVTQDLRK
ncbi:MAG: glutathione S-transferase family protein [Rhizobiaceae bacterium]|nr:glutathione S-transferase family protein [Rhizobiaceae bacterium]